MQSIKIAALDRRSFLSRASTLSAAALFGFAPSARAEPPPEVRKLRLPRSSVICIAPQYLAEELLRQEGFTDIEYLEDLRGTGVEAVGKGDLDFVQDSAPTVAYAMERQSSVVALAGLHVGCFELFGNERVHAIRDLKGKTVAIYALGGGDHVMISSMLAYVGMDPRRDVKWLVDDRRGDAVTRFVGGEADALMAFAPQPIELRRKKVGHVIINTAHDRPWSQYFCCMLTAHRDFVASYPIATKRVLRAHLKAADICAREPERVARYLADKGYEPRYDVGLEVLKDLSYDRWRHANPQDTLLFYALRLKEVGMLKSDPAQLVARSTDWRFLNELKKELKA
jgi:NitT/TauT family transport system substrate-binding protein